MPQVTDLGLFLAGSTYERDGREAHYRVIVDDDDRIMVLMCHNTDLADGWEWVGENELYDLRWSNQRHFRWASISWLCVDAG